MGQLRFLQCNLNHCARAQDLMVLTMAQRFIDVAVVSEPYSVTTRSDWFGDLESTAAVVIGPRVVLSPRSSAVKGHGFVAVSLESFTIVSVYFSPNKPLADFEDFLLCLTAFIGGLSHPVVVAGDFNAKSTVWGSPATNARGRAVVDWMTTTGLVLLNRGNIGTCVRQRGESIVDITLVSPSIARRIGNWRVLEEIETLSDHRYIYFDIPARAPNGRGRASAIEVGPRWSLKGLDKEMLLEAAIVASWAPLPAEQGVDEAAEWLNEAMVGVCDASMPRIRPSEPRRRTYWWRPEIKQLREDCVVKRRHYARYRRRQNRSSEEEESLYAVYRTARMALSEGIKRAKTEAWKEWLATLERDPWGRPYKWVRQKLRPAAPPIIQSLDPELRQSVLTALFPPRPHWAPPIMVSNTEEADQEEEVVPPVTSAELGAAVYKMGLKSTAPGRDGVPGRAWVLAMEEMESRVLDLLTRCLVQGQVPCRWKIGKLVLLRKDGRPINQPSAYRPIVLLDEVCKMLERVVAARIKQHLDRVGPNLSNSQYGFRAGRSTIGAIAHLRDIVQEETARGGVVLAVSLDISNAFNSLPWETINEALKYHRVPKYLRRVIHNYLSDRSVQYPTREGVEQQEVECGVPQGSALGPDLWNIGYDWVLRGAPLPGVDKICYADDTLAVVRGRTHREAVIRGTAAVALLVHRIRALGLRVALEKSEAIIFHGPRNKPPPRANIIVGGTQICVKTSMTYLGLVLDSRWTFKSHFARLSERVSKAAGALAGLLPNLGGPSLTCRRLYLGVIQSMVMYGAPIWTENLSTENRQVLGRLQRIMAIRAVRGYRTVSRDAACALAGSIPWDIEAESLASVYWRCQAERREMSGNNPPPDIIRVWKSSATERALAHGHPPCHS